MDQITTNAAAKKEALWNLIDQVLLDDEQQETITRHPWNLFFLKAACLAVGNNLALKDKEQADLVARIVRHARSGDVEALGTKPPLTYNEEPVHLPLLVAILALAIRLDLTHPLTIDTLNQGLSQEDVASAGKAETQFDLISAEPHPFLSGTIRLGLTCSHPGVHRALKHHETRVQQLLHKINGLISPRFLYSEVVFEIKAAGYCPMDMKFSVDAMAAMKLLTGNRLYSDQRVFLRELVQNAVDACNLKRLSDPGVSPDIRIDFSADYKTIRFRDNGIGMDRQWMEKYFLKIGISFYQSGDSKNLDNSRVDASFISKFGIGFLSSFLAAEQVVVTTRKAGQPGLLITIHTLQDYFDVRLANEDCPEGTEVCLHLSAENVSFAKSMQYVCYLKTNLRFLTVPVTLTDHLGRQSVLGSEPLAYEKDESYNCEFVAPLMFKDAKGFLFMKTKRNKDTLYALENAKGGVSIFQDGIFVTQTTDLLPEGARQNVIGRINLTGRDRCELSMDRNRIFWTDAQLRQIKQTIRSGIVALADMAVTGSSARGISVSDSLINHLAIFFDFNEITDEMYDALTLPVRRIVAKRFQDFVRINFAHTGNRRHVPDADGYNEGWQREILAAFANRSRPTLPE